MVVGKITAFIGIGMCDILREKRCYGMGDACMNRYGLTNLKLTVFCYASTAVAPGRNRYKSCQNSQPDNSYCGGYSKCAQVFVYI